VSLPLSVDVYGSAGRRLRLRSSRIKGEISESVLLRPAARVQVGSVYPYGVEPYFQTKRASFTVVPRPAQVAQALAHLAPRLGSVRTRSTVALGANEEWGWRVWREKGLRL
jgi:hypothetical protein